MNLSKLIGPVGLSLFLAFANAGAWAQKEPPSKDPQPYVPSVGQEGKDVVWVPTSQPLVDRMLDMAKATPADFVMDLGSGDGRLVIAAAKRGIRALGVEYDRNMVELSRRNAAQAGVSERAEFVEADLFKTDFTRATVITMFLLPDINLKLRPQILALKPGTRVVSNSFDMGDWDADETAILDPGSGCTDYCTARLWIVPAKVAGLHKTAQGELKLEQTFQMLTGSYRTGEKLVPVRGRVVGDDVFVNAGGQEMRGKFNGKQLSMH